VNGGRPTAAAMSRQRPRLGWPGHPAKTLGALLSAVTLLAATLAGCGPKDVSAPEAQEEAKQLFHEGKGLKLPQETQRSLGLKTAPAGPQTLRRQLVATAQAFSCYTNSNGSVGALASAFIPASALQPQTGAPVQLRLPGSPTAPVTGVVVRVDETMRAAFGQLEVVVDLPSRAEALPAGGFVEARLDAGPVEAAIAVPREAVVRAALGDFAYVAEGEFFKRVPVKVGAEDSQWTEILSGLSPGQTVVSGSAESLWLLELSEVGGMANLK